MENCFSGISRLFWSAKLINANGFHEEVGTLNVSAVLVHQYPCFFCFDQSQEIRYCSCCLRSQDFQPGFLHWVVWEY